MDRTLSPLAEQASFPFLRRFIEHHCAGPGDVPFLGACSRSRRVKRLIIQGSKWDDRGVSGSYESPQDVPELYWGDQNGSLEEVKGA